jgi:SAM-dependent methyltransferase
MAATPRKARLPAEPLAESAPLARHLASRRCDARCAWYHGLWQHLRLLGLIEPWTRHARFFRRALRKATAGRARPRILICGAADYAMLAHVLAASAGGMRALDVTVIDLCETPLELNRWYAKRLGVRIKTRRTDILRYRSPARFDVICTHALFGRFSPRERIELAARWRSLLRPGGAVITVTPLREGQDEARVGFSAVEARAFASRVVDAALRQDAMLGLDTKRLARMALGYAKRHKVYRVRSLRVLRGLFEDCGFTLAYLRRLPRGLAPGRALSGPTVTGADYAHVVALRA